MWGAKILTDHRCIRRFAAVVFFLSLTGMASAYWVAAFRFESAPGRAGVFTFFAIFGAAFIFYTLSLVILPQLYKNNQTIRWSLFITLVAAMLRLLILPAGISYGFTLEKIRDDLTGRAVVFDRFLLYDNDVWRYLWDGHQQAAGLNPYAHAPADLEPYNARVFKTDERLQQQLFPSDTWRDIWENVSYKEVPTVYPPLLEGAFRLAHALAPGSVLCWKLLLVAFDLALCLTLAGLLRALKLPAHYLAVYAWNPLVIKEIAGSAHADVIPALLIALALLAFIRGRSGWGGSLLALGVLAKLSPIVLFPFVWLRMTWLDRIISAAVVILGFAPFLAAAGNLTAGFSSYSQEWIFNPGAFELFRWVSLQITPVINPSMVAKALCAIFYLGLLMIIWRRPEKSQLDLARKWLLALGGLLFFSSAVMPWYFVWLLPIAALCRKRAWLIYSALCFLSYWVYIRGDGVEEAWRLIIIHGGFVVAFIIEELRPQGRGRGLFQQEAFNASP